MPVACNWIHSGPSLPKAPRLAGLFSIRRRCNSVICAIWGPSLRSCRASVDRLPWLLSNILARSKQVHQVLQPRHDFKGTRSQKSGNEALEVWETMFPLMPFPWLRQGRTYLNLPEILSSTPKFIITQAREESIISDACYVEGPAQANQNGVHVGKTCQFLALPGACVRGLGAKSSCLLRHYDSDSDRSLEQSFLSLSRQSCDEARGRLTHRQTQRVRTRALSARCAWEEAKTWQRTPASNEKATESETVVGWLKPSLVALLAWLGSHLFGWLVGWVVGWLTEALTQCWLVCSLVQQAGHEATQHRALRVEEILPDFGNRFIPSCCDLQRVPGLTLVDWPSWVGSYKM